MYVGNKYVGYEYVLLWRTDVLGTTVCGPARLTWPGDDPGPHNDRSENRNNLYVSEHLM